MPRAVQWSSDRLRAGGLFAIDDYVGATYNQHPPELVAWGTEWMASLPERLRRHWNGVDVKLWPFTSRIAVEDIIAIDPSECADSAAILPSIRDIFPDHQIVETGGAGIFLCNDAHLSQLHVRNRPGVADYHPEC